MQREMTQQISPYHRLAREQKPTFVDFVSVSLQIVERTTSPGFPSHHSRSQSFSAGEGMGENFCVSLSLGLPSTCDCRFSFVQEALKVDLMPNHGA